MENLNIRTNSFEINKLITITKLFSKISLMQSSRLVLRCIVDYWNYKEALSYPTQKTISKCTGLSEVSVIRAIKELEAKNLIQISKKRKRIYYCLTITLLNYLELIPKVTLGDTLSSLSNIPKESLGKNIIKNNENISLKEINKKQEKDFNYLMLYAKEKGIENVNAYVEKIMKNGNYDNLIKKYKDKEQINQQQLINKNIQINREKEYKEWIKNASCPLDWDKEKAIEWLNNLPDILQNSLFAVKIREKYML